jgi:hypothetical protein
MYYAFRINEEGEPGEVIAWSPVSEASVFEAAEPVAKMIAAMEGETVRVRIVTVEFTRVGVKGFGVSEFSVSSEGVTA